MENLTAKELEQLKSDLAIIKAAYLKELEREKNERTVQDTKDTSEAKVLAEEKKLEQERLEKEALFREQITKALKRLESEDVSKTLTAIDSKLLTISENFSKTEQGTKETNVAYMADLAILFILFCVLPVIVALKVCDYFFRDVVA